MGSIALLGRAVLATVLVGGVVLSARVRSDGCGPPVHRLLVEKVRGQLDLFYLRQVRRRDATTLWELVSDGLLYPDHLRDENGMPLSYTPGVSVCAAGYDQFHGTGDDYCVGSLATRASSTRLGRAALDDAESAVARVTRPSILNCVELPSRRR